MIKVYHFRTTAKNEFTDRLAFQIQGFLKEPRIAGAVFREPELHREHAEYVHVADVATDDYDEAWHLTNHIDEPWTLNPGVTPVRGVRHRSSSVGDILVLVDSFGVEQEAKVTMGCGFAPV